MKKRTGIMAHGRYLQIPNWEKIIWGEPPGLMGQFPKAILVALQEDAEIIVLGSGLHSGINGEIESEFNRQYIWDRFYELSAFDEFGSIALERAKEKIERILVLDRESSNTIQEINFSGTMFEARGIERVIGVTAPTHGPRCLNEALKFYGRSGSKIDLRDVSVRTSDVGWASNDDVVIFEPPHRLDDPMGDIRLQVVKMVLQPGKLLEIKKALGL